MSIKRGATWALVAIALLGAVYALISAGYWRGVTGGRTVAVPARYGEVWLVHQPWRMADAAPPPADPVPFAVLYGPNVVGQSFRAAADNLARVRFWLDGVPGQQVTIALSEGDDTVGVLCAGQVVLGDGQRGDYHDLAFPPIPGSKGQRYTAWVQAPEATVEQAVALRIAPGDAVGGQPSLNGYPVPGNLDYATYHRGWAGSWWLDATSERVLPHVFRVRIQQYKPSWAKGHTFEILVTGGVLLALALLVIAWPGQQHWLWRIGGISTFVLVGGLVWELATGGLVFGSVGTLAESEAHESDQSRAILDALMSKRPGSLEAARDAVPVEWVTDEAGDGDRYALLTTAARPFRFSLHLPPDSALRFGVRAIDASAEVSVSLGDEHVWQGQTGDAWQQIELDLSSYAGRKATIDLASKGSAWWSAPHVVSEESWLLPYPLPAEIAISLLPVRFGGTSLQGVSTTAPAKGLRSAGDEIELLGYALERTEVAGNEPVELTLYWRALQSIAKDYTVFVHLIGQDGQLCGGADSYPVLGTFPTSHWPVDRVVADQRTVRWNEGISGPCQLEFGLYELETLQRLPAFSATGEPLPGDRVLLDVPISVKR